MSQDVYTIRSKIFSLLHRNFHIYDDTGAVAYYCRMKAFKLREDIRIYTGEDMANEVINIKARQIFDFGATYDVRDAATGEPLGALRRRALKSMLRDEWAILDTRDGEIGIIQEDSMTLALVRRGLGMISDLAAQALPQRFSGSVNGAQVLEFRRHLNPFVLRMDLDFTSDANGLLDRRLGIAAGLLFSAIEGRQE